MLHFGDHTLILTEVREFELLEIYGLDSPQTIIGAITVISVDWVFQDCQFVSNFAGDNGEGGGT